MELILKKTVESLGREGDVVKVKPGFARNYLLPQGMAVNATRGNLALLEQDRATILSRHEKEQKLAQETVDRLAAVTLEFKQLAGTENRLFGSITAADIATALKDKGLDIDRRNIVLGEPIKVLGNYTVQVKVGYQVQAPVQVQVLPLEA